MTSDLQGTRTARVTSVAQQGQDRVTAAPREERREPAPMRSQPHCGLSHEWGRLGAALALRCPLCPSDLKGRELLPWTVGPLPSRGHRCRSKSRGAHAPAAAAHRAPRMAGCRRPSGAGRGGGLRAPTHDRSPEKQPGLRSPSLSALPRLVRAAHCWVLSKHLTAGGRRGSGCHAVARSRHQEGKGIAGPTGPRPRGRGGGREPASLPLLLPLAPPLAGQLVQLLVQLPLQLGPLGGVQGPVLGPTARVENPFPADPLPSMGASPLPTTVDLEGQNRQCWARNGTKRGPSSANAALGGHEAPALTSEGLPALSTCSHPQAPGVGWWGRKGPRPGRAGG